MVTEFAPFYSPVHPKCGQWHQRLGVLLNNSKWTESIKMKKKKIQIKYKARGRTEGNMEKEKEEEQERETNRPNLAPSPEIKVCATNVSMVAFSLVHFISRSFLVVID